MNQSKKHTATPYKIITINSDISRTGKKLFLVSKTIGDYGRQDILCQCNDLEKAEFIVRACNSHSALVEACKEALSHLECCASEEDEEVIQKLESALKLAKGE